jgi:hypothetical protein
LKRELFFDSENAVYQFFLWEEYDVEWVGVIEKNIRDMIKLILSID